VTLTAPAGYTYLWSSGATTRSINVSTSGSFTVTVNDANACTATSAATIVTVNANPSTPTITAGGPTTFCNGGSVTPAAPTGNTAQKAASTNNTFKPPTGSIGTFNYWVRVTSGTCTADSATASVTVN